MTKIQSIREWAKSKVLSGNTAKGNAFEQRVAAYLRANGWIVDVTELNRTVRKGRWVTKKGDFFGCFDLIAVHPVAPWTVFIQATTAPGEVPRKTAKIDAAFNGNFPGAAFHVVIPGVAENDFRVFSRYNSCSAWEQPRWGGPLSAEVVYTNRSAGGIWVKG